MWYVCCGKFSRSIDSASREISMVVRNNVILHMRSIDLDRSHMSFVTFFILRLAPSKVDLNIICMGRRRGNLTTARQYWSFVWNSLPDPTSPHQLACPCWMLMQSQKKPNKLVRKSISNAFNCSKKTTFNSIKLRLSNSLTTAVGTFEVYRQSLVSVSVIQL